MLKIKVHGIRRAVTLLKGIEQRVQDLRPLFEIIRRDIIVERIRKLFISNGFGTWKRTKANHPILRDTYALYHSYTELGAIGNVHRVSPNTLVWGSDLPYAEYHEEGTRYIDARKVIGLLEERRLARDIEQRAEQWLQRDINRAGGGRR